MRKAFSLANSDNRDELHKYMTGAAANKGHTLSAIGGMPDHVHIIASLSPKQSPSDLPADVKRCSSLWINERRLVRDKFSWQESFGAFCYGKSQIPDIAQYIETQEKHHKR